MIKRLLYTLFLAVVAVSCTDRLTGDNMLHNSIVSSFEDDAVEGELLIKFVPEMEEILKSHYSTRAVGGVATRSGIPSTDEVLDILGAYSIERVFPVDPRTEERTREAGLHLWYKVSFDRSISVNEAKAQLSRLGEVSKMQCNRRIYSAGTGKKPVFVKAVDSKETAVADASLPFNDPDLNLQWGYINKGGYSFEQPWAKSIAECDVNCKDAWKLCTGDSSIVVAVMDEGVMWEHPDLLPNIWVNSDEKHGSYVDNDNNGFAGDRYGYNFASDRGYISSTGSTDSGHGTHVAGTIAAVNNNGVGVCGIAGGDAAKGNPGVKIMSLQIFDDSRASTVALEAKAFKYAADNGAVVVQCSWGYNSAYANIIQGFTPGPESEEEWEALYPLEKESIDYFVENAGSPNGVIDGGIVVFAAGNESAGMPAYPGAYSKCISVSAVAADFTPATYTDYGVEVDFAAPGGDGDYYGVPGSPYENGGMIYSTLSLEGKAGYGFYEGTSMSCPHVSGVIALGLSYAAQQRRHFTAEEFIELMYNESDDIERYFTGEKLSHYNHSSPGSFATKTDLAQYKGKMGKLVNAGKLLAAIEGAGREMQIPNVYLAPDKEISIDLARFFKNGKSVSYGYELDDETVAAAEINGSVLTVKGKKEGFASLNITVDGNLHTVEITVRKGANSNGWL